MSVGRLRVTSCVCKLCVVLSQRWSACCCVVCQMTGVQVLMLFVGCLRLRGWVVGGFVCAVVVAVVLGDAWPLSLSTCYTFRVCM